MTMTLGSVCLDIQVPPGWRGGCFLMGRSNNPTELSFGWRLVTSVSWSQVTNGKEKSYHLDRTHCPWSWWGGRAGIIQWGWGRKALPLRKYTEMFFGTASPNFDSKWAGAADIAWEGYGRDSRLLRDGELGHSTLTKRGASQTRGGSRMGSRRGRFWVSLQ